MSNVILVPFGRCERCSTRSTELYCAGCSERQHATFYCPTEDEQMMRFCRDCLDLEDGPSMEPPDYDDEAYERWRDR